MTLALTALSLMSCGASGLPAGLENEVANLARQGFCQTAGTSCGAYKTVETRKASEGDQWCIKFTIERTENNARNDATGVAVATKGSTTYEPFIAEQEVDVPEGCKDMWQ